MTRAASPRRRASAVLAVAVAGLVLAFTPAAPASASIGGISPSGPYAASGRTTVNVWGTRPAAASTATHVALVLCNTTITPVGTACDISSASGALPVAIADYEDSSIGVDISIAKGPWDNYSFLTGTPTLSGGQTTCKGGVNDPQCAVSVTYYQKVGNAYVFKAFESQNVTFS